MAEFEFSSDWGYSDEEREIARNTALRIISESNTRTLPPQLPKIIEWYAGSPHEEDARELLDAFLNRLLKEDDALPDRDDYESHAAYEEAWENTSVYPGVVIAILNGVRNSVPMKFIASNAYIIEQMADVASEFYRKAWDGELLNDSDYHEFALALASVAGLADYFRGRTGEIRADAMENLASWFETDESVQTEIAQAFERGLEYDRRAGTLRERLPWLRWFFDQIPEDEFWRGVFVSHPAPLAAGFQYLVWMSDSSMEDKTRAMWYSYLGDLARSGVRLEPDDVLHMGRASELMGRLLCGQ